MKKIRYKLPILALGLIVTAIIQFFVWQLKSSSLTELLSTKPEYFIVAAIVLLLGIAQTILLVHQSKEDEREASLRKQLDFQNNLIKHLIKEYSEIYYVHTFEDKSKDTSELLFKGGIIADEIFPPHEDLPFAQKLDYFIENIVVPEDRARVRRLTMRENIAEKTVNGSVYAVDFKSMKNGETHYYQVRFARVNDSVELNGYVLGLRLVDDEVHFRDQLAQAKAKAEAASEAKTAFLFSMSHDIRTPMNAIKGYTEIAEKNINNPPVLKDCLSKTKQAGNLLLSLVNSVLEMSRIEAGREELNEKPCAIGYAFVDIDATMQSLAAQKDINLSFEFGPIEDHYVFVDIDRCNRVLTNIISNAIKYTGRGGRVKVKCEETGRQDREHGIFRFTVEDNGIGMSEEFQKHLFEEFSRENSTTTSGVQGSGLGLSVAKSLVELMDGSIRCRSKQGEGSTFIITLPLRLQDTDKAIRCVNPVTKDIVEVDDLAACNLSAVSVLEGKRILLVEDNEMNREIARFILEEDKMVVEEVCDGSDAVAVMEEKGPDYYDLILMDIQMPKMNGYDATRAIRSMYPDAKLPIVALSANAFEEDRTASLAAGMNAHIAKPINTAELIKVLTYFIK